MTHRILIALQLLALSTVPTYGTYHNINTVESLNRPLEVRLRSIRDERLEENPKYQEWVVKKRETLATLRLLGMADPPDKNKIDEMEAYLRGIDETMYFVSTPVMMEVIDTYKEEKGKNFSEEELAELETLVRGIEEETNRRTEAREALLSAIEADRREVQTLQEQAMNMDAQEQATKEARAKIRAKIQRSNAKYRKRKQVADRIFARVLWAGRAVIGCGAATKLVSGATLSGLAIGIGGGIVFELGAQTIQRHMENYYRPTSLESDAPNTSPDFPTTQVEDHASAGAWSYCVGVAAGVACAICRRKAIEKGN